MRENNIRYIKRKKECLRQHQNKQAWDIIRSNLPILKKMLIKEKNLDIIENWHSTVIASIKSLVPKTTKHHRFLDSFISSCRNGDNYEHYYTQLYLSVINKKN